NGRKLCNIEIDSDFSSREFVRKRIELTEIHLLTWSRTNIQALLVYCRKHGFSWRHFHSLNLSGILTEPSSGSKLELRGLSPTNGEEFDQHQPGNKPANMSSVSYSTLL